MVLQQVSDVGLKRCVLADEVTHHCIEQSVPQFYIVHVLQPNVISHVIPGWIVSQYDVSGAHENDLRKIPTVRHYEPRRNCTVALAVHH